MSEFITAIPISEGIGKKTHKNTCEEKGDGKAPGRGPAHCPGRYWTIGAVYCIDRCIEEIIDNIAGGCDECDNNASHEHARWDDVAGRCLACANCTMVCPTCFCHTVEETPDLTGQRTEHARLWDSCFAQEHGYIHGKNIRPIIKDRYRMWLTHKLASWIDQFGASGCVGCGRCITWCRVGIDLTEELSALLKPSITTQQKPSQA